MDLNGTCMVPKRKQNETARDDTFNIKEYEWKWEHCSYEVEVKSREASAMSHDDGLQATLAIHF